MKLYFSKSYFQFLGFQFIALLALTLGFGGFEYYKKSNLLSQTAGIIHNSVMSYDFRNISYSLSPLIPTEFSFVELISPDLKQISSLGEKTDSILSSELSANLNFNRIDKSVNRHFEIKAQYSLFSALMWALATWFAFAALTLPLFNRLQKQNKENSARNYRFKQLIENQELSDKVAHDIRSPLSLINILSRQENILPEHSQMLNLVSERISEIIRDLSINSRVNSQSVVGLGDLLTKIIEQKRFGISSQKVKFNLNCEVAKNCQVLISPAILTRILSNIISNSIEATDNNGSIELNAYTKHKSVVVEISDTGKGIKKELLSMVGLKGFSDGKEFGTGLGVYSAKIEIEKIGGSFEINSIENRGTKVKMEIPYNSVESQKTLIRKSQSLAHNLPV